MVIWWTPVVTRGAVRPLCEEFLQGLCPNGLTSVDVDRKLIADIKRLTAVQTDREVIREALKKQRALANQKQFLGRIKKRVFTDQKINPDPTLHAL